MPEKSEKPVVKKRNIRIKRTTEPGSSPSKIIPPTNAKKPRIFVMEYNASSLREEEIFDLATLKRQEDNQTITYVRVLGLGDAKIIKKIGDIFGLHLLTLADVVSSYQRIKMEDYGDYIFFVLRTLTKSEGIKSEQFNIFIGKNFVITFQEFESDPLDNVFARLRGTIGRIRTSGSDYLAYAIIDAIIDSYFPIVDSYGDLIEKVDQIITTTVSSPIINQLHDIRHDVMILHRYLRPLKDALIRLMTDNHPLISAESRYYFRDCYDHALQLTDLIDSFREISFDQRQFYLSAVNLRMNEVMKVLTLISTIFIPLSFVASVYGMNFDTRHKYNLPELSWPYGYPLILIIMAIMTLGQLYFFWRRGWLFDSIKNIEKRDI